ncbi:MAG TPA: aminotransferase class V-fold PLP-dependent enzyme [Acidimicrobiales bacterium]|nr:aminotransferase class V-fold PLP-dependent enzyme [Acidimicrobiales bacterium]
MPLSVAEAREFFPSLKELVWLNHGGGAPMHTRARDAVERAATAMTEGSMLTMTEGFAADRNALFDGLASMLNADPAHLTLTRATAHGLGLLAGGLDWNEGDNVVGAWKEFPTNLYPWMALADRGVELRRATPQDGRVGVEQVLEQVDDRTRVVALSLVQFWNGYRADVAAIGAACRERGVIFAVDAMQAVGAVRVDVESANVDLLAAGSMKWLLGTWGIGFCWLHPALIERLRPVLVGMGSVADPFGNVMDPALEWAPGARRFQESAASWLDIAAFRAGVELLADFGHDAVEERVVGLTTRLAQALEARGHEIAAPWPRRSDESSGLMAFRTPGRTPDENVERALAAGLFIRAYGDTNRVSPHFYNSEDELDRLVDVLSPKDN